MVTWFAFVQIAVAVIGIITSLVVAARKSAPNDYSLGITVLLGILLIAQIVVSIAAPAFGNHALGDPLEFWMYLIVAAILPFGAGLFALIDRKPSANLVLAVVHLSVAVMIYRMLVIWGSLATLN